MNNVSTPVFSLDSFACAIVCLKYVCFLLTFGIENRQVRYNTAVIDSTSLVLIFCLNLKFEMSHIAWSHSRLKNKKRKSITSMDPANKRAQHRSALGLSRELQQDRTDHPSSPSRGGSRGYPLWLRLRVLDAAHAVGVEQASDQYGVSTASIYRWQERVTPYRMTGGEERAELISYDLLLLTIVVTIFPCATLDEIATFILANGGEVYSNPQISERLKELQITRKRCAKEAYDAFSERTQRRVRWFMTLPPPLGVYRVLMQRLIDIDETGFYLKSCSPNYGRGLICQRVRNPSHYIKNALRA